MAKDGVAEEQKEKAEAVIQIISGGDSVMTACEQVGMNKSTFFYWLIKDDNLADQYARARQSRADARFESLDDIMAELKEKKIDPQTARVLMDAIKWQCGKEKGAVYGDSTQLRHANADGSNITINSLLAGFDDPDKE